MSRVSLSFRAGARPRLSQSPVPGTDRPSDAGILAGPRKLHQPQHVSPLQRCGESGSSKARDRVSRLGATPWRLSPAAVALRDPRRRPRPPLYRDFPRLCSRSPGASRCVTTTPQLSLPDGALPRAKGAKRGGMCRDQRSLQSDTLWSLSNKFDARGQCSANSSAPADPRGRLI